MQRSKASHSALVTNIATMICMAVRHCQSTSNSVASPHKKIAGWPSHLLNKEAISGLDMVCMQNIGARAAGQY